MFYLYLYKKYIYINLSRVMFPRNEAVRSCFAIYRIAKVLRDIRNSCRVVKKKRQVTEVSLS